jgi:hypothetical protein
LPFVSFLATLFPSTFLFDHPDKSHSESHLYWFLSAAPCCCHPDVAGHPIAVEAGKSDLQEAQF